MEKLTEQTNIAHFKKINELVDEINSSVDISLKYSLYGEEITRDTSDPAYGLLP